MSPWRKMLYRSLAQHELRGRVIDLGGDKRSGYHELLRGNSNVEIVNLASDTNPDHAFDLEKPFELPDASYDGVICLNILEHIYNHERFLSECRRIVRPGGTIVLAVPFLMQVHPSPHDYFRYTEETLRTLFEHAGFRDISIQAIGKGPFTAAAHIAYNALTKIPGLADLHALFASALDSVLLRVDKKGTFSAARYPLGYLVKGRA